MSERRRPLLSSLLAFATLSAGCSTTQAPGPKATAAAAPAQVAGGVVQGAPAPAFPAPPASAPAGQPAVNEPAATAAATLRAAAAALAAAAAPKDSSVREQPMAPGEVGKHEVAITVLTAPTHLFGFAGATVLTDPGAWIAQPGATAGARGAPGAGPPSAGAGLDAALAQLARLDAVVLSRDDAAHLDAAMAKKLWQDFRPDFMVPPGASARLVRAGVPAAHVFERRAWQRATLAGGVLQASYVPTEAPKTGASRRPAMGVVFRQHGHDVLFVAHGQLGHHFQAIHNRFGSPAVSVLPVVEPACPGEPAATGGLAPREAVLVHRLLNSELGIASAAGAASATAHALAESQAVHGINADCFVTPQPFRTLRVALDRPGPCSAPVPVAPVALPANAP